MADPPLNKLYSIILTIFSCTKQAEARAYHTKLRSIVTPKINKIMLIAAFASVVSAPWIGFFDVHYNFPLHMVATMTFTAGDIVYLITLCVKVVQNRAEFHKDV